MGYHRAGFDVIGVDIEPQPNYPFEFHQADAFEWFDANCRPGSGFAAVHASPPCQLWTAYRRKGHGVGDGYPDLIPAVRRRVDGHEWVYAIENVGGAPLGSAHQLCGSSFGLDVRRHRRFETNLPMVVPTCNHGWQTPRFPPATNRTNLRSTVEVGVWRIPLKVQQRAMGIDWMELEELTEAVPPAYTEFIGRRFIEQLEKDAA